MNKCKDDTTRDILIRVDTEVQGMRREMTERFDKVDHRLERGDEDLKKHGEEMVRLDGCQKSAKRELREHKERHNRRDGILISILGIVLAVILGVAKLVGGI